MRKSSQFFICLGVLTLLMLLSLLDATVGKGDNRGRLAFMQRRVAELELTDLALFTEARYTRHISQADLHTPFQDHPFAMEHFPSGSLTLPPTHL
jgi:hypothetical protein